MINICVITPKNKYDLEILKRPTNLRANNRFQDRINKSKSFDETNKQRNDHFPSNTPKKKLSLIETGKRPSIKKNRNYNKSDDTDTDKSVETKHLG